MTAKNALLASALLVAAIPSAAHAADRAIVVFDASGSMWGQIDGRAKIEIAREAVGPALAGIGAEVELGLMAYGHRDKGRCDDIELMVEPASGTAEAIARAVAGLRPKGKTPIAASVRQAADLLRYTEDKATVILVTDGIESCDADPCALADELERDGVDFTAHVVGFGLTREEGEAVACLAERTGGLYLPASDAASLGDALATTVAAAPAPVEVPEPTPDPEPEPAVETDGNLSVNALIGEGGNPAPEDAGVAWQVRRPDGPDGTNGEWLDTGYGPSWRTTLEPGEYEIEARIGSVEIAIPITVEDGAVAEQDFVFEVGRLTVKPVRATGEAPIDGAPVTVTNGAFSDTGYGASSFWVPAGTIEVSARSGNGSASLTIAVGTGESVETDVVIGTGIASASALYAAGGPAVEDGGAVFQVMPATPELDGRYDVIDTGYGPSVTFELPPGEYRLTGRVDKAEGEAMLTVEANARAEAVVIIDGGVAAIAAPDGIRAMEIVGAKKTISGDRTSFETFYQPTGQVTLPAGDYIVVVTPAEEGAAPVETPFTVVAGERTEVTVTP